MYLTKINYMSVWTSTKRLQMMSFINREKRNGKMFCSLTKNGKRWIDTLNEISKKEVMKE
jgi:hypothetical protein